ncbi:hypothetical protein PoB_001311500 [Plakobranchus ocellatus]|uniref:Uncharacterized protein n=1 Tax=Plakobranchus ocellatus TaxID=259542 RepID=A0AAV3YUU5_9GAST|nr:hypothetical protein PoB_001311500 [Plakobranchus ocellatus]
MFTSEKTPFLQDRASDIRERSSCGCSRYRVTLSIPVPSVTKVRCRMKIGSPTPPPPSLSFPPPKPGSRGYNVATADPCRLQSKFANPEL